MNKVISKERFIEWLAEHETALDDFCSYFGLDIDDEDVINKIDLEEAVAWLTEHKTLCKDFVHKFSSTLVTEDEELYDKVEELFGM